MSYLVRKTVKVHPRLPDLPYFEGSEEWEAEQLGTVLRRYARETEQVATKRELGVINLAYNSPDERVWALADGLLGLLDARGAWADRLRVVKAIEGAVGGGQ